MPSWADPLDVAGRLDDVGRHVAGIEQGAPHHLARVGRMVVAVERVAHHRAHAVGADYVLGLEARAVLEGEHHAVAALLQSGEPMPEVDLGAVELAGERVEQVGAVE